MKMLQRIFFSLALLFGVATVTHAAERIDSASKAVATAATSTAVASGGEPTTPPVRKFPPFGFPCLGCYPCPPDFCDTAGLPLVANTPPLRPKIVGKIELSQAKVYRWPGNKLPKIEGIMRCLPQKDGSGVCHDTETGHGFAWGPSGIVTAQW